MKMLAAPENILAALKCVECKEVIKNPPIYSKKNEENVCGKCITRKKRKNNIIRNVLFEKFAETLLFPCKYEKQGCKLKLKWGEANDHEEICEFGVKNILACPSLPKCTWRGPYKDIQNHYKNAHPDLMVKHPYSITSYENWIINEMKTLKKVSFRHVLMEAHGFMFLLKMRACFQSEILSIRVVFLGDSNLAVFFETFVEILQHNQENLLYVRPVEEHKTNVNDVNIPFHKSFKLSINFNIVKCSHCEKTFEKLCANEIPLCCEMTSFVSCNNRKLDGAVKRCLNHTDGCQYIDIQENIEKHSFFLCKHNKKWRCSICYKRIYDNHTTVFDHITTHMSLNFVNAVKIEALERVGCFSKAYLKTVKGNFHVRWGTVQEEITMPLPYFALNNRLVTMSKTHFFCSVLSDIPTNAEDRLHFKLYLRDKFTGEEINHILNKHKIEQSELPVTDWRISFPIDFPTEPALFYELNLFLINV